MVDPIHTMVSLTLPLSLQPPLMTQRLHLCLAVLLRHLLDHKALLRVPHFTPGGSTVTTRPPNISYHICSRRSRSQTIPVLQETQHNPPQEISQLGIPPFKPRNPLPGRFVKTRRGTPRSAWVCARAWWRMGWIRLKPNIYVNKHDTYIHT